MISSRFISCFLGMVCLLFTLPVPLFSQKILPDTIYVEMEPDRLVPVNQTGISEVKDLRDENPNFIRYGTRNKLLLIPVDQEVYLTQPLATAIAGQFPDSIAGKRNYELRITHFVIEKQPRKFSAPVVLAADIQVYHNQPDSLKYLGTLYYDYPYTGKAKGEDLAVSTQKHLNQWHGEFKIDLISLQAVNPNQSATGNFITNPATKSLYMNTRLDGFAGVNWWGMQGEIIFSRPETSSRSIRNGALVRYMQNKDYESIAFGKKSEHLIFRRSELLTIDLDLNILLGFCKWKNIEESEPTLYQIFDFELSSIQSVMINPLNRKGVLLRVGIIENLSYVIGKPPRLLVGGVVGVGIKI